MAQASSKDLHAQRRALLRRLRAERLLVSRRSERTLRRLHGDLVKILHISDTHGMLPEPQGDWDVVVHSGDMMPNRSYCIRPIEDTFQKYWLEQNVPKFHSRYWLKPFLYTPGNHDYVDPTPIMRNFGIDARLVCNDLVDVDGVSFYGHPWTPTFYDWAWMCGPLEMEHHLTPVAELLNQGGLDVLIAHGPMFGVLDRNQDGERCGCKVLRKTLQDGSHAPKALLHGHIHEAAGIQPWSRKLIVSNAARTQRVVEL